MFESRYTCPVIIGRQRELGTLNRLLHHAALGNGQTVLVAGEAGVGKSRLLTELAEQARKDGWLLLLGHCYPPDVSLPYAPLLDALRIYFHSMASAEVAEKTGPYAPELLKLLPELVYTLPGVQPSTSLEPQAEKRRLFEAIYGFLASLSSTQPLLLAFEDLHWADDTTLQLLHLLARRTQHNRILTVTTYRLDEPVAAPGTPWLRYISDLERERLAMEIRLDLLDAAGVSSMLQRIFGLNEVSPEFALAIYSRTEGNPFFVEELLKALVEAGDIFYAQGSWNRKMLDDLNLPRSVRDAILRHLDSLDDVALEVGSTAAVMGRQFDFDLLREVSGFSNEATLGAIRLLIGKQLVSLMPREEEMPSGSYRFRHALTRDAIYSRLLPQERQVMHSRVAETIERMYAANLASYLPQLAYHYWEAGAWQQAMDAALRAGEQARDLYAPQAAIEHFSRALDAARHLSARPPAGLYRLRGLAYETLGDFDRARADHEAALLQAKQGGDLSAQWHSLTDLGVLWAGRDYSQTGAYFAEALDLARGMGDALPIAHSLNRLANWLENTGKAKEGLDAHYEALKIFEDRAYEQGKAETLDLLGMSNSMYGDIATGLSCLDEAIALFRRLGDNGGLASSLTTRAAFSCPSMLEASVSPLRPPEYCVRDALEALLLTKQIGWSAGQAYAEFATGSNYFGFGNLGEGRAHAQESLNIATEIEHQQWMAGAHYTLAHAYVALLQPGPALSHLESALSMALTLGSAWWECNSRAIMALAYILSGDTTSAEAALQPAISPDSRPRNLTERRMLYAWGELAVAQGDPEKALHIIEILLGSMSSAATGQQVPALLKVQGIALTMLHRHNEALVVLERAKQGALQRTALTLLWEIQAALVRLGIAMKRDDLSSRELVAARQTIASLGDTIGDETARGAYLQSAFGCLPDPVTVARTDVQPRPAGLTLREIRVLSLVALGKSNRQIATELSLSERTVEHHLTSIFSKTGTENRAGATAFAMREGLA